MPCSFGSGSNTLDRRNSRSDGQEAVAVAHQSLIDELEAAVAQRNIGSRADVLRRVSGAPIVSANMSG